MVSSAAAQRILGVLCLLGLCGGVLLLLADALGLAVAAFLAGATSAVRLALDRRQARKLASGTVSREPSLYWWIWPCFGLGALGFVVGTVALSGLLPGSIETVSDITIIAYGDAVILMALGIFLIPYARRQQRGEFSVYTGNLRDARSAGDEHDDSG
jgi:polyferredoxin